MENGGVGPEIVEEKEEVASSTVVGRRAFYLKW
jgi:hypothetical protein